MNKNKRAKEIFRLHSGSHYFMYREGYIEEYESFKISKETEMMWNKEM